MAENENSARDDCSTGGMSEEDSNDALQSLYKSLAKSTTQDGNECTADISEDLELTGNKQPVPKLVGDNKGSLVVSSHAPPIAPQRTQRRELEPKRCVASPGVYSDQPFRTRKQHLEALKLQGEGRKNRDRELKVQGPGDVSDIVDDEGEDDGSREISPKKRGKIAKRGNKKNVLNRMEGFLGPLELLYRSVRDHLKVKVWIRSAKHVRGFCTGYVVAFDQHWNLAMVDVDELYKPYRSRQIGRLQNEGKKEKKRRGDTRSTRVSNEGSGLGSSLNQQSKHITKNLPQVDGTADSTDSEANSDDEKSVPAKESLRDSGNDATSSEDSGQEDEEEEFDSDDGDVDESSSEDCTSGTTADESDEEDGEDVEHIDDLMTTYAKLKNELLVLKQVAKDKHQSNKGNSLECPLQTPPVKTELEGGNLESKVCEEDIVSEGKGATSTTTTIVDVKAQDNLPGGVEDRDSDQEHNTTRDGNKDEIHGEDTGSLPAVDNDCKPAEVYVVKNEPMDNEEAAIQHDQESLRGEEQDLSATSLPVSDKEADSKVIDDCKTIEDLGNNEPQNNEEATMQIDDKSSLVKEEDLSGTTCTGTDMVKVPDVFDSSKPTEVLESENDPDEEGETQLDAKSLIGKEDDLSVVKGAENDSALPEVFGECESTSDVENVTDPETNKDTAKEPENKSLIGEKEDLSETSRNQPKTIGGIHEKLAHLEISAVPKIEQCVLESEHKAVDTTVSKTEELLGRETICSQEPSKGVRSDRTQGDKEDCIKSKEGRSKSRKVEGRDSKAKSVSRETKASVRKSSSKEISDDPENKDLDLRFKLLAMRERNVSKRKDSSDSLAVPSRSTKVHEAGSSKSRARSEEKSRHHSRSHSRERDTHRDKDPPRSRSEKYTEKEEKRPSYESRRKDGKRAPGSVDRKEKDHRRHRYDRDDERTERYEKSETSDSRRREESREHHASRSSDRKHKDEGRERDERRGSRERKYTEDRKQVGSRKRYKDNVLSDKEKETGKDKPHHVSHEAKDRERKKHSDVSQGMTHTESGIEDSDLSPDKGEVQEPSGHDIDMWDEVYIANRVEIVAPSASGGVGEDRGVPQDKDDRERPGRGIKHGPAHRLAEMERRKGVASESKTLRHGSISSHKSEKPDNVARKDTKRGSDYERKPILKSIVKSVSCKRDSDVAGTSRYGRSAYADKESKLHSSATRGYKSSSSVPSVKHMDKSQERQHIASREERWCHTKREQQYSISKQEPGQKTPLIINEADPTPIPETKQESSFYRTLDKPVGDTGLFRRHLSQILVRGDNVVMIAICQ